WPGSAGQPTPAGPMTGSWPAPLRAAPPPARPRDAALADLGDSSAFVSGRRGIARMASVRGGKPGLGDGRLEQLDRVPGRVVDQHLLAAHAGDDVVAEVHAG